MKKKLSKTGMVALAKQYRSVLKKCLLINAGLFMFTAVAMADTVSTPTYYYQDMDFTSDFSGMDFKSSTGILGVNYLGSPNVAGEVSKYTFTDLTVSNNEIYTEGKGGTWGGVFFVKGADAVFNDVVFTDNVAGSESGFAGGAAVYVDSAINSTVGTKTASATFNITKDTIYSGNDVYQEGGTGDGYGTLNTTSGGFLYLDRDVTATFNISDGATLTIGEEGIADTSATMDGIASSYEIYSDTISYPTIYKTGEGELVINSNLTGYYGNWDLKEGGMTVNSDWDTKAERTFDIASGATLTNNAAFTNAGILTNSGTLVNNGTVTNTGTLTFTDGSSYTKAGDALIDGDVTLIDTVTLNLQDIELGTTDMTIVDGTVTGYWTQGTGFDNTLYNISWTDDQTAVVYEAKSSDDIASSTGASSNSANALSAIVSGGTSGTNTAFDALASSLTTALQSGTDAEKAAALQTVSEMSADTTSSAQSASISSATATFGAVGTRMSGGAAVQNMASGDNSISDSVWMQGMTSTSKLSGSNGFDADTNGFAFGVEKQMTDSTKVGLGYAYTSTDITTSSRSTDADTNAMFIYGEYKPNNWFINTIASYSLGTYDESSNSKTASYDVDTFGVQVMTGYDMQVCKMDVTPEVGLRYMNIEQMSYIDSLGSSVSGDTSDVLTAVVGTTVGKTYVLDNGMSFRPEFKAAVTYDVFNDDSNSVVTLANGSSYTTNGEALDKFGMEFGVGVTAELTDSIEMSISYGGRFRSDYQDHTGMVNFKYNF